MRITSILLLLLLAYGRPAAGQSGPAPGGAASAGLLAQQYFASFASYPLLFNGPEYADYAKSYRTASGHQFFIWPEWQNCSIVYNDHAFAGLTLSYDIVLDQVVLQQSAVPLTFRLANGLVRSFTLGEHRFTWLTADSLTAGTLSTGYYEVLLEGPATLLARRIKKIHERKYATYVDASFEQADQLFLRKAGTYAPIETKGAVLAAFADHGKEIQKYIQSNRLSFKENRRVADILQVVRYYNTLSAQ
jgi:hypothetical protein